VAQMLAASQTRDAGHAREPGWPGA